MERDAEYWVNRLISDPEGARREQAMMARELKEKQEQLAEIKRAKEERARKAQEEEERRRKQAEEAAAAKKAAEERAKKKAEEEIAARKAAEEEAIKRARLKEAAEKKAAQKKAEEDLRKSVEEAGMKFIPDFLQYFLVELKEFNEHCKKIDSESKEGILTMENNHTATQERILVDYQKSIELSKSAKESAFKQYESKLKNLGNEEQTKQKRDELWKEYQKDCEGILQNREPQQENALKTFNLDTEKENKEFSKRKETLLRETKEKIESQVKDFIGKFPTEKVNEEYAEIYAVEPFDQQKRQSVTPKSIRTASLTYDLSELNLGEHAKALLCEHYPSLYRHGKLNIPYCTTISETNGIYFEQNNDNRDDVYKTIQAFILKFLLQIKPGLVKLTLYDGEGSGKNLIGLSHIDKRIKGENILTDQNELKRALESAVSGMNTTIQKVLGSKYADKTLMDYNEIAGDEAKPYHIIVMTDFPKGLGKEHLEMISKIVRSGRQAGVFVVMSFDKKDTPKNSYDSIDISPMLREMKVVEAGFADKNLNLFLSSYFPETEELEEKQDYISAELKKAGKVKVSLDKELREDKLWQSDSRNGIKSPIGKLSVTEAQDFILSEEESPHHCLIGGGTGSGKTVLLHNIICNTAWNYSPDEVQFILLDYKEGTEFKVYENLPHAKVLSIHSEREYGISVLEYINAEIEERGKKFKEVNAQNIAKYRENTGKKMPRLLVIIDEFQKLLDGDMRTTSFVSAALDDIGRRGRSFGVNLILSSQSLLGVDINQALSHLGLRICLKLNAERDCDYFLGHGNHAPFKSLQKVGEAIYNARSGLTEGNVRFQVAYLSDKEIGEKIVSLREKSEYEPFQRFVYDGNVNASIKNNKNIPEVYAVNDRKCEVYIGEPVALKEKHSYYFLLRQNESNVLITGQDILAAMSIFSHSIEQIVPQSSTDSQVYICNKVNMDSEYYGKLDSLPKNFSNVQLLENDKEIEKAIETIFEEVKKREAEPSKNRIILAFADIYNMRALRKSGYADSPLTQKLITILKDGPGFGIHSIIHASSFENLKNVLDTHSMLNEFNVRIELRGGDGYKIFQSNEIGVDKSTPNSDNIANLQTSQTNGIRKIKVYGF